MFRWIYRTFFARRTVWALEKEYRSTDDDGGTQVELGRARPTTACWSTPTGFQTACATRTRPRYAAWFPRMATSCRFC